MEYRYEYIYTSAAFQIAGQQKCSEEKNGVLQSMSRKGNCLDNAPIESFFGLFKNHLDLKGCRTIEEVEKEVTRLVDYYNEVRPQTGFKKMPPNEYRRHFY